ncbi:hypothetical protein MUK42_15742 [Musa troglodytarum]|uniref:Uncharacterized protein n=1 Tax=Musa troglodytarum TaxID=320322 RepID=A0A9E7GZ99_9LILI|nr:hypothetical protein MUK42_15742 [Musa troglodytarum]
MFSNNKRPRVRTQGGVSAFLEFEWVDLGGLERGGISSKEVSDAAAADTALQDAVLISGRLASSSSGKKGGSQ